MEYRWYAVQTTAGHENKVRMLLSRRIEEDPRPAEQKLVRQVLVPVQEAIEIKNGKKVVVERKLYPGYVLIETTMSQEAQHMVNSVQGVIKFVGTGKLPQALRNEEVNRLLGIAEETADTGPKEEIPYLIGQAVEITEGPFADFSGTVEEVLVDKGKVKVSVSLFGRPTTVELDYLQLRGH
jgi:transcription termination/antitermination protein NusG